MTIEEEIVGMLRMLNAMSRRNPRVNLAETTSGAQLNNDNMSEESGIHSCQHRCENGKGRTMALLADNGSMSQTQLAAHLEIRPQSLSELLCRMETDGLILRRQSKEDKRQTIVSLTDEGAAGVASFREAHRQRAEDFLSPLSSDEKLLLADILKKLIENKKQ